MVARQSDVPRKQNQAKIATINCRTLISDVRVKEFQQLASDMSIELLAVQEHERTSLDVHRSLLLPGWQFLPMETPAPGVGGIGFLLSPRAVKTLLLFSFPSHHIEKLYFISGTDVFTHIVSMHRQQSIITKQSAAHSLSNFPPWSLISLY